MIEIHVDKDSCVGCGLCVKDCPMNVYELKDGLSVPVRPQDCMGCLSCHEICPAQALDTRGFTLPKGTISTFGYVKC